MLVWLIGVSCLPDLVWAVPHRLPEAVHQLEAAVERIPERLPAEADMPAAFPARCEVPWPLPYRVGSGHQVDLAGKTAEPLPLGNNQIQTGNEGRWIGVLIYAAYYQPKAWAMRLAESDGLAELTDSVQHNCIEEHDAGLDVFVPVVPQKHPGYATYT